METMQLTLQNKGSVQDSAMEPTEGARKATGTGPMAGSRDLQVFLPPDPEVPEKKPRRKFTAKYKLQILAEADTCTHPGQLGSLLRREGIYSSYLTTWRRQRKKGILQAMPYCSESFWYSAPEY